VTLSASRRAFFEEGGAGVSCSFLTRVKEPGSFFTQVLDAPDDPGSFFGRRGRVGADGGDPMTMPLPGVDEDEREEDDTGPSILCDSQCRIGIVSRG
jgi:hypothetical protein